MVMISRRGSVELRSAKEGCEKGTVLYGQGQESRLRSWRRESLCPFLSRKFIDCLVGTRVLTLHSTCELGIDEGLGVRKVTLICHRFLISKMGYFLPLWLLENWVDCYISASTVCTQTSAGVFTFIFILIFFFYHHIRFVCVCFNYILLPPS